MKKEIEIEFKSRLSQKEYEYLYDLYSKDSKIFEQSNYYFDTLNLLYRNKKLTIRIRKSDKIELTTKYKFAKNEAEENTIIIDEDTCEDYLKNGFNMNMFDKSNNHVYHICNNHTTRLEFILNDCTFCLDKTVFNDNIIEYELEMETKDIEYGERLFYDFLKEHNLKYIEINGKVTRTFSHFFKIAK